MSHAPPLAFGLPPSLGRYQLLEPLGSGGMATVVRVWDPLLRVDRALKILHRNTANDDSLRKRFLREARALGQLLHPNVLRIYDVGEENGFCWYAMGLVSNGTVQRALDRSGPFAPTAALRIAFQVLQALGAAHRAGLVHRDVKPSNILLMQDGTALLGDFGCARDASTFLTRTGDVLGTLGYMAPEQRIDARQAGHPADIYAVGASIFGMVTGRAPLGLFEGELDEAPLGDEIREIVRTATRYATKDRYASARAMADSVADAQDRLQAPENPSKGEWMARFDLLIEGMPTSATSSVPRSNTADGALASLASGLWEGRIAGILPLRFELAEAGGDTLAGWVVTNGLSGPVVTKAEAKIVGDEIEVVESTDRPDGGSYRGRLEGDRLEGTFQPRQSGARALPFELRRSRTVAERSEGQ